MDIAGVDCASNRERFEVVYCLLSLTKNHRLIVERSRPNEATPVPTRDRRSGRTASWYRARGASTMYGVLFAGHPDLRRIRDRLRLPAATRSARTSR